MSLFKYLSQQDFSHCHFSWFNISTYEFKSFYGEPEQIEKISNIFELQLPSSHILLFVDIYKHDFIIFHIRIPPVLGLKTIYNTNIVLRADYNFEFIKTVFEFLNIYQKMNIVLNIKNNKIDLTSEEKDWYIVKLMELS